MYQKIKAKFKANPTIFYACSIVASWADSGAEQHRYIRCPKCGELICL